MNRHTTTQTNGAPRREWASLPGDPRDWGLPAPTDPRFVDVDCPYCRASHDMRMFAFDCAACCAVENAALR
mgnify:CR=1 FL=1|jgi:hypothetical protein